MRREIDARAMAPVQTGSAVEDGYGDLIAAAQGPTLANGVEQIAGAHELRLDRVSAGVQRGAPAAAPDRTVSSQQKKEDGKPRKEMDKYERFVSKYAAAAVALEDKDGVPALFTLAQGALESGWGDKAIGNALFGIKASPSWKGKKQLATTTEYLADEKQGHRFPEVISIKKVTEGENAGKYKYTVKDWFRDYDTVEEGLEDHSAFLIRNKRYWPAFATETPEAFAQAVADAGYATGGGYGGTLKSMIASVKKRWPAEAGAIPPGNARAKTGGKPGGGGTQPVPAGTLRASVGEGGVNDASDALIVKGLLIKAGYDLTMTPAIGPKTIGYIKDFQRTHLGWKSPDGLVEPGGSTWKALSSGKKADGNTGDPAREPKKPGLDDNALAQRLHEAMFGGALFGLGTDEGAIFGALGELGRDGAKIQRLVTAYQTLYGRDLRADLRSELSDSLLFGDELSKALDLLTDKDKAPATQASGGKKKPGPQAGSVGGELNRFFHDFSHIQVVSGKKTVSVVPPYHINADKQKDNALAARAGNADVVELLADLIRAKRINPLCKIGKSQPADLKAILEEAVSRGLVEHDATKMRDFLARYGLSVDCSGYVSQALNFLVDHNQTIDKNDALQPGLTGSGSLKGGTANFTKIALADIRPGDTMHLTRHIRIINEVVRKDGVIFFRTTESTAAEDPETKMNGLMTRWWKYEDGKKYRTWKGRTGAPPDATDSSWKQSHETNTFGRYKQLEK